MGVFLCLFVSIFHFVLSCVNLLVFRKPDTRQSQGKNQRALVQLEGWTSQRNKDSRSIRNVKETRLVCEGHYVF